MKPTRKEPLMKNQKLKYVMHMLVCIIISFVFIYLIVFFGAWKLIESGDQVLIEIAFSIPIGLLLFVIYELSRHWETKFKQAENRITELENQVKDLGAKQSGGRL